MLVSQFDVLITKSESPLIDHVHSLEKEPNRRATPWRMLEHPWMVEMKAKRVNMTHFLRTVWDWQD